MCGTNRSRRPGVFETGIVEILQKSVSSTIKYRKNNWELIWKIPLFIALHLLAYLLTFPCRAVVVSHYWSKQARKHVKDYRAGKSPLPVYESPVPMKYTPERRLSWTGKICSQDQSVLYERLPAELRVIVWTWTLGAGHACDISHMSETFLGDVRRRRCMGGCPHQACSRRDLPAHSRYRIRRTDANAWTPLALLFTCKLIYSESIESLYRRTIFEFHNSATFIKLPTFIPDRRVQDLRRLRFNLYRRWSWCREATYDLYRRGHSDGPCPNWNDVCRLLRALTSLDEVKININYSCSHHPHKAAEWLMRELAPLWEVKAFSFCVTIEGTCSVDLLQWAEGAPFRLRLLEAR